MASEQRREEQSSVPTATAASQDDYYTMDVRVFILMMATLMVSAFSLGVYMGPDPVSESSTVGNTNPMVENASSFYAAEIASVDSKKPISEQLVSKNLSSKRRLPTTHAADLGRIEGEATTTEVEVGDGRTVEQLHVQYQKPSLEDLGDDDVQSTGDSEEHLPAGQHLLVDIRNLSAEFLNSEERLAHAMVETVKQAKLTLLSYHCHSLVPAGVSCVGVLLESHISFHTWPDEGVITLDLFTCGSNPLIPIVPVIEKLFGIPRAPPSNETCSNEECTAEEVQVFWSHELRGFRHYEDRKAHYLDLQSDLALWVTSPLDLLYKKEIVSIQSPYQRIDIWDTLDFGDTPSYQDAQKLGLEPGDPRWMNSKYASPARLLFLDGTLQSVSDNEHEYHEALVHPAMFAHPNPKRVAIVGGGEGATLREVLKHKTVEEVKMIEIDELMIEVAKEHLPAFHNCSMFSSVESCFDDPRAEVLNIDGRQWFIENFGSGSSDESQKVDVIIIDALDPEDDKSASDKLYSSQEFLDALYEALTPEGVIVSQVGTAPNIHDPKADMGVYARRERMFQMLEAHPATAAMLVYEEAHCGFNEPHSFLVICKSDSCRERWYAGSDAIDFKVYERIFHNAEAPTLEHFDGSTQYTYQFPPKAWETVYCRREPMPYECQFRGLDLSKKIHEFDLADESKSSFRFTKEDDGTTHVYATQSIAQGDYVMASDLASSLIITDPSKENLVANTETSEAGSAVVIEDFLKFIDEHGHKSLMKGVKNTVVEIGGSYMIRKVSDKNEANVDRIRAVLSDKRPPYSPVLDRHRHSLDVFLVASRDIQVGEEILKYENVWG